MPHSIKSLRYIQKCCRAVLLFLKCFFNNWCYRMNLISCSVLVMKYKFWSGILMNALKRLKSSFSNSFDNGDIEIGRYDSTLSRNLSGFFCTMIFALLKHCGIRSSRRQTLNIYVSITILFFDSSFNAADETLLIPGDLLWFILF